MRQSVYERIERERIAARQAALEAERKERELARLRCEHAAIRVSTALIRLQRALQRKYRPDQPRVPAGNPDGGQWTSEGGGTAAVSRARRIAEVIQICVTSGKSLTTNEFGVKRFRVIYECPGGQTIEQEGFGHSPAGFIRDPYQNIG